MFLRYCLLIYCFIITGCGEQEKYPYTIRDFPSSVQAALRNVVTTGVAGINTFAEKIIDTTFSNAQLQKLSRSEHPLLRAVALRLLLDRDDVDHQSLILSHLDDTALVSVDWGEWGYKHTTIADDVLTLSAWKTEQEKEVIVNKVITEHNYLLSAYKILPRLEPKQEYYLHIKNMIDNRRMFEDMEGGLYLLAKYKRREDIAIIKKWLMYYVRNLGVLSFRLMKEYPDTAYLSVLDNFERRGMLRKLCEDPYSTDVEFFFETLASYKQKRAAEILSRMLYRQPLVDCRRDNIGKNAKKELMVAIWENPCPEYAKMNRYIKDSIEIMKKNWIELPAEPAPLPADINERKIYW
jgi:hypothetical protein